MKDIKEETCECEENICMSIEDILNDVMLCEKTISNNYSVAINEMSNKYLYKKIMDIFDDTKDMAREIYNYMYSCGYYNVTAESDSKIEKSFNKYSDKIQELS